MLETQAAPTPANHRDFQRIYQSLFNFDEEGAVKRLQDLQKLAATYDPERPETARAISDFLGGLSGRPVLFSETQLLCFKEVLFAQPGFAHIAPFPASVAIW
jgi:hypothetical protein